MTLLPIPNLRRLFVVGLFLALPAIAVACSIPVFRYAIEHWRPDAYQVFVYHDEDLSDTDRELLGWVKQQQVAGANVEARTIDLRQPLEPSDQTRWERLGEPKTPRMLVQLPKGVAADGGGGGEAIVGATEWNEAELQNLVSSPLRVELGERLVNGEVVWVFLDSGTADQDNPLFELLQEQLAIQQESIELPAIEEQDLKDLGTEPEELVVRFSALRVGRDDPAERWFREMLLSVESDLRDEDLAGQPMVFPVFGRGRALYALVGQGINADMIGQAAIFLTGACQCTVKQENPGVDLLLAVRWDDLVEVSEPEEVSLPLVGLGGGLPLIESSAAEVKPSVGESAVSPTPGLPAAESPAVRVAAAPSDSAGGDVVEAGSDAGPRASAADVAGSAQQLARPAAGGAAEVLADSVTSTSAPGLLVPIIVLLVIGTIVGLLGTSILRKS
ncbi:MAG: hypothetical protein EA381_17560 [Planctomycetaceae bacterium]|nr:MAG: hypothetical protein EA381_17560 [Planctomycetaceae bacterium]